MGILSWWVNRTPNFKENFAIALNETGTLLVGAGGLGAGALQHYFYFKNEFELVDSSESLSSDGSSEWSWSLEGAAVFLTVGSITVGLTAKAGSYFLGSKMHQGCMNAFIDWANTTNLFTGTYILGEVMHHDLNEHYADYYQYVDGWNRNAAVGWGSGFLGFGLSLNAVHHALFFRQKCIDNSEANSHNAALLMNDDMGSDDDGPKHQPQA